MDRGGLACPGRTPPWKEITAEVPISTSVPGGVPFFTGTWSVIGLSGHGLGPRPHHQWRRGLCHPVKVIRLTVAADPVGEKPKTV